MPTQHNVRQYQLLNISEQAGQLCANQRSPELRTEPEQDNRVSNYVLHSVLLLRTSEQFVQNSLFRVGSN